MSIATLDLNVTLTQVQDDVAANCASLHYANAYRQEEKSYWQHVPEWMAELPQNIAVMDAGAAYGTLAVLARRLLNARVTCLDVVPWLHPKALFEREDICQLMRDVERADISDLGLFDLIIFTEILEHLNFHPVHTLLKLRDRLKVGGTLLLTTPDGESDWGRVTTYYSRLEDMPAPNLNAEWVDGHIWQYSRDELKSVLRQAGFEIEKFGISPGARLGYSHLNVQAVRVE